MTATLDDMNGIAWAGNKGWLMDRKQSSDEVEHRLIIMNYQKRGMSYLWKPKAEVHITDRSLITHDIMPKLNSIIVLLYIF